MADLETMNTPQMEAPVVEEPRSVDIQDEGTLVEDVIFGGEQKEVSEAFVEPHEQGADPILAQEEPSIQPQAENDEVRYQYWQSQADKLKNERDQLQQQFNTLATQPAQPEQYQQEPEPEPEIELPAPPEKPERPYNFSIDESISDPNSDSAKFSRDEQTWRDEMDEYKNLQFEYQMAMLEDERHTMKEQRQQEVQRVEADQQQAQELTNVRSQVMNQFKVDTQTAEDFVRVMSDPESISLDNLWRLYASDKGLSTPQNAIATPSGDFQQVRRAQQVPASMGVLPSQNRQNQGSVEDTVMDSMITDFNKQNPFN